MHIFVEQFHAIYLHRPDRAPKGSLSLLVWHDFVAYIFPLQQMLISPHVVPTAARIESRYCKPPCMSLTIMRLVNDSKHDLTMSKQPAMYDLGAYIADCYGMSSHAPIHSPRWTGFKPRLSACLTHVLVDGLMLQSHALLKLVLTVCASVVSAEVLMVMVFRL